MARESCSELRLGTDGLCPIYTEGSWSYAGHWATAVDRAMHWPLWGWGCDPPARRQEEGWLLSVMILPILTRSQRSHRACRRAGSNDMRLRLLPYPLPQLTGPEEEPSWTLKPASASFAGLGDTWSWASVVSSV